MLMWGFKLLANNILLNASPEAMHCFRQEGRSEQTSGKVVVPRGRRVCSLAEREEAGHGAGELCAATSPRAGESLLAP